MGWIKSTRCDNNACIRLWPGSTTVWVEDSTQRGQVLVVPRADFRALVDAVKAGELRR